MLSDVQEPEKSMHLNGFCGGKSSIHGFPMGQEAINGNLHLENYPIRTSDYL